MSYKAAQVSGVFYYNTKLEWRQLDYTVTNKKGSGYTRINCIHSENKGKESTNLFRKFSDRNTLHNRRLKNINRVNNKENYIEQRSGISVQRRRINEVKNSINKPTTQLNQRISKFCQKS